MINIDDISSGSPDRYNSKEEWKLSLQLPKIEYEPRQTFSKFFGFSYASLADIRRVLLYHVNGYFHFIEHKRDIFEVSEDGEIVRCKVPHTHIYFYDGGRHTTSAVEKWFKDCRDENGRPVNTFFEPAVSERGCLRYLIHLDDPEKTAYALSEVHVSSYTAGNKLYDACSASGNSLDRQISTCISFARGEINYIEACKKCPELFLRNYNNARMLVSRFCFDLGIEDRFVMDEEVKKEEIDNGIAINSKG